MAKSILNLDGPLLKIPSDLASESFDYVGRYQLIGEIIKRYYINTHPRNVLDVGGRGGFIDKLVNAPVTILDEEGGIDEGLENGDGARMNILGNTYDVVVSSDTLEHIPKNDRNKFINELIRVSNDLVILCAPFSDFGAAKEEQRLQDQYTKLTGRSHRWLKEHSDYQLPKLSETIKHFKESGFSVVSFGHSSLDLWRCLMEANLLSHEMGSVGVHEKLKAINLFYNSILFNDFAQNSYRSFVVLSKKKTLEIKIPENKIPEEKLLKLVGLINEYFNATLIDAQLIPVMNNKIELLKKTVSQLRETERQYHQVIQSKSWRYTSFMRSISGITNIFSRIPAAPRKEKFEK